MNEGNKGHGSIIYTEDRPIRREQLKFILTGMVTLLFVLLVVYAGHLHSPALALLAFVLFGLLLYPAIMAILLGITGIRQLKVFEKGFVPPYCSMISRNIAVGGFFSWKDVAGIYSNKNIRLSRIFPYLAVELRHGVFCIPADQIININMFLETVRPYTRVVTEKEYRPGIRSIDYFPPSGGARLDDDALVLPYRDHEERIAFGDIRKVRMKMNYQLMMKNGQRVGLLGMGRDDVEKIREAISRFLEGRPPERSDSRDGLLRSTADDDEHDLDSLSGSTILGGLIGSSAGVGDLSGDSQRSGHDMDNDL